MRTFEKTSLGRIVLGCFGLGRSLARVESGSALVEFSFTLLPLLALLFLTFDIARSIFARATLQHAVREGVRYAVTGQVLSGYKCLGASVQQVVARNSFGFVPAARASSFVAVTYYSPANLSVVTGSGSTAGGNVVQVAISGVAISPFGAIWHSASPIPLSAIASDVLESPPNGTAPCP